MTYMHILHRLSKSCKFPVIQIGDQPPKKDPNPLRADSAEPNLTSKPSCGIHGFRTHKVAFNTLTAGCLPCENGNTAFWKHHGNCLMTNIELYIVEGTNMHQRKLSFFS